MNARAVIAAAGAGATVFLVVAVAVIELLPFEFSALVGLPLGVLTGGAVLLVVSTRYNRLRGPTRHGVHAAAGFGLSVLAVQTISYVNLAGLRSALTLGTTVAVALVAAALASLASWLSGR